MSIHYDETLKTFHLQTPGSSYVLQIIRDGHLSHRYWGARVEAFGDSNPLVYLERPLSPNPYPHEKTSGFSLDTLPREYPGYGTSDFREPAFRFECEDGSAIVDLRYHSHRIFSGKPVLEGLPQPMRRAMTKRRRWSWSCGMISPGCGRCYCTRSSSSMTPLLARSASSMTAAAG